MPEEKTSEIDLEKSCFLIRQNHFSEITFPMEYAELDKNPWLVLDIKVNCCLRLLLRISWMLKPRKIRDVFITLDSDNTDMMNLEEETFNMGMMSSSWKKL